ncbi:MAG: hypothetical protein ACRDNL_29445, partial [Spirillospora sp.]
MSSPAHSHRRVHRAIVCVDIEKFGRSVLNDSQRADMREGLYELLERAFGRAGIRSGDRYHEDRGDGAFFLVPTEGPQARLVVPLPFHLASELRRYNQAAAADTRLRLRVALHAGYVHHDPNGVVGTAVNEVFRLLDAPQLKSALRETSCDLAYIASAHFHREVIRPRRVFDSAADRKVRIDNKEPFVEALICAFDEQTSAGLEFREGLARARAALASVDATLQKAREIRAETVAKISSPVPDVTDPAGGLRDRLDALDEPGADRRWEGLAGE